MKAIIPVNVAALRVSANDQTNVTGLFRGATAAFDKLPYRPHGARPVPGTPASTGAAIALPLDAPTQDALGLGVHLHWALPDYFRRGGQATQDGPVRFPQVPNRWLVTRTSSPGAAPPGSAADVSHKSWVIESNYVSPQRPPARAPGAVPARDLGPAAFAGGRPVYVHGAGLRRRGLAAGRAGRREVLPPRVRRPRRHAVLPDRAGLRGPGVLRLLPRLPQRVRLLGHAAGPPGVRPAGAPGPGDPGQPHVQLHGGRVDRRRCPRPARLAGRVVQAATPTTFVSAASRRWR